MKNFNIHKTVSGTGKLLITAIWIVCYTTVFSQDLSEYYGTHKGKFFPPKIIYPGDVYKILEYNEITVNITPPNKINIVYHIKYSLDMPKDNKSVNEKTDNDEEWGIYDKKIEKKNLPFTKVTEEFKGTFDGFISKDLTYEASGITDKVVTHEYVKDVSSKDLEMFSDYARKINGYKTSGKITDGILKQTPNHETGKLPSSVYYEVPLVKNKNEDCDVKISIPDGLKPGGKLYVITETTGCIKSEVVYYNGKDNQISSWDGKAVNVEVQISCCNGRAFFKKFQVPAYGSDEKVEIKTEQTNKGGSLPVPSEKQVITGTAISLAIIKLLQGLLGGRGKGTGSGMPPPSKPPKGPNLNKEIKKDPDPQKDKSKTDEKSKPEKKGLTPKQKEERMKVLRERQEELVKQADRESVTLNPKMTLVKNLIQTVPNSLKEIKETGKSLITVGRKVGELGLELYNNPLERERLDRNFMNTMEHVKTGLQDYYNSGKYKEDFNELKDKLWDINKEHLENLWNDPKKTLSEYLSTAFGAGFYKNAFNPDKPLGERLLNLGAGYIKTIFTLGTAETGNILSKLTYHETTLISHKLAPLIPELLEKGKEKIIIEAVQIKVHNKLNEYMKKPENTTMIHNINDIIENYNNGYMKNGIFVHYGE